jgi:hypothetical protein
LTAEQLEASRIERMRLNGHGTLTFEDARTWIEETGLCLFLPKRQFAASVAPSFVEAVAGQHSPAPDPKHIALAEELLVRLELEGIAVRLNLLGQPGEHPDYVVAAWVLPYVYALRGDRDWRRSPQLTGSRQVSQLAVQAYKLLEAGDTSIPSLKHTLGREVTEGAVLRAITELWQQLRIIPVIQAPGQTAKWQLLRTRFQKAIAEGASTSQVTAISVLASIYLQAVIAASMEEVEMFLAPLTARSKVREVLRGLLATRQVHTISLGHAPHFYVAGTLPEFAVASTIYSSSSMPASAYFLHSHDHEDDHHDHRPPAPVVNLSPIQPSIIQPPFIQAQSLPPAPPAAPAPVKAAEVHAPRIPAARKPAAAGKPAAARPRFTRPAAHTRDRKQSAGSTRTPAGRSSASRTTRSARPDSRTSSARPAGARPSGTRPASGSRTNSAAPRWSSDGAKSTNGSRNGAHNSANGARSNGHASNGHSKLNSAAGNGHSRTGKPSPLAPRNGHSTNGHTANGHSKNGKSAAKPTNGARSNGFVRGGTSARKDSRSDARSPHGGRKPALTAGAKAGNSKRFGFTAPRKPNPKKRG